ncbi:MAG: hypothetical protein V4507_08250 [Verrucomicrobiota bacterium]
MNRGFSLVEVILSIGIVSFSILMIMGLMSVGMEGNHDSYEEAFAVQTLKSISLAIQQATHSESDAASYTALAPFNQKEDGGELQWKVGKVEVQEKMIWIGYDGLPTQDQQSARLVTFVRITAPSDFLSLGKATVTVAWPADRVVLPMSWIESRPDLKNIKKHIDTVVYLSAQNK